ncbi:hypothetical protein TrVFT333_003027 [Trichoderma virens FT-333]|nr:hypothetical protein TrVFT333_003027 [Trichoderma virens FT-333]
MAVPRSNGQPPPGPIKYAYMFEADKSPTMQFDALLRSIARFIVVELGDKSDSHLTPKKLAAFYKAVGGDYDSLFLETPHSTISYMWSVTGCQHSLQPTESDFDPPSIPALTPRGFSRWESVEILLGPEEHVPFIQYAVKHWGLRHPETGQSFPPDLPASVFPAQSDQAVDRWHKECASTLRDKACKEEEETSMPSSSSAPRPEPSPEPSAPRFAYVHTADPFRPGSPRSRAADPNQYERFTYVRVGERHGANFGQRPPMRSPERSRRPRPADDAARRRSFSDYASTRQPHADGIRHSYSGTYLNPDPSRPTPSRPGHGRRHSHAQHHSSGESSGDESVEEDIHLRSRRRQRTGSPSTPGVRRVVPPSSGPPPSSGSSVPSFRTHRSDSRAEDARRRASPFGNIREKVSETVSNILPGSRNSSRHSSVNDPIRVRRSREHIPPSRLNQNHSDLASDGVSEDSSEEELRHRRQLHEERDRYRTNDQDSSGRRDRQQQHPRMRPDSQRRTSSHADADRRRDPAWDMRDRDRMREDRKWDRRSMEDGLSNPGGIPNRRYQESAYT